MTWDHRRARRTFLDYFVQHETLGHREVPSSPIIPSDDPTLLFTNAGMNQFKAALLGDEIRDYNRACSVQKCMRVGGKHNDLDAVGKDGRHLTWFEMLGNWSFGDYYKLESIKMSWDLSINVYGLDPDRIYVSVHTEDDESFAIWRDEIGLDPKRIYRFDEDNFWSMGPTGPCGPSTELFYDLGPEAGTGPEDYMGGEGDRYMEYWNNVFMAFNRFEDGHMEALAKPSVDTGLGMERIAMMLQGKVSAYETDLFQPIIKDIVGRTGADWDHLQRREDMQVIADHIRSLTFVLSEGGRFSNEGRGYVLRRILRRAVRHGRRLGFDQPFLWEIAPKVAEVFEGIHDLPSHIVQNTCDALKEEEGRFFRTIDRGMKRIHGMMAGREGKKIITGKEAFELYDTFGFPVDLTSIEAREQGFQVDTAGFDVAMEAQRQRSREGTDVHGGGDWTVLNEGGGKGFTKYGQSHGRTKIMRWRQDGDLLELVLKRTPFYAESGGELGDRGWIEGEDFKLKVVDVKKINGLFHHYARVVDGTFSVTADAKVTGFVDTERRGKKAIHHTATHLLHGALKAILGPHVEQKGSVVEPDRLRFDFSHGQGMSMAQIEAAEAWVAERIRRNEKVRVRADVPIDAARAAGVVALFGEKYGDKVRTVRAGGDSFELCGGNHTDRTGDIGSLRITSEGGVSAGVRRIEAVVGHAADALVTRQRALIDEAAGLLKTDAKRLPERITALQDEVRALKKALEKARQSGGSVDADTLIADAHEVLGVSIVSAMVKVDARETLAALVDRIRDKRPGGVVTLGAVIDGKVAVIAAIGPQLKKDKRFHAGKLVKALTALVDGRGGGRPDFAQGAGNAPDKLAAAMAKVPELVENLAG